jgi:hypothetical protein
MLCSLNISVWEGRKKDRDIEQEIADNKGARSKRATSVHKHLFVDCPPLEAIKSLRGEARLWLNRNTLEWNTPWRLLTTARYFEVQQDMANFQTRFDKLVQSFVKVYSTEISKQAFERGAMFNRDEYPKVEDISGKFRFAIDFNPVPLAGDFRVDIGNIALQELRERCEADTQVRLKAATSDAWNRVKEQVEWVLDRMTAVMEHDPEAVDEERIYGQAPVMGPNPRFGLFIQDSDENAEGDLVYTDTDELEPAEIVVGYEEKLIRVDIKKKRRPKLHESMLDQGLETCGLLRDLNVTNDPDLEEARRMLEKALVHVDMKSLKESPELQATTKNAMQAIKDKFAF